MKISRTFTLIRHSQAGGMDIRWEDLVREANELGLKGCVFEDLEVVKLPENTPMPLPPGMVLCRDVTIYCKTPEDPPSVPSWQEKYKILEGLYKAVAETRNKQAIVLESQKAVIEQQSKRIETLTQQLRDAWKMIPERLVAEVSSLPDLFLGNQDEREV